MPVRMIRRGKEVGEERIKAFEKRAGVRLPDDYREFLLHGNGGVPEPNEFLIPSAGNCSGVTEFMSIEDIESHKDHLGNRLVRNIWPIAYAECGDLVCIALGDEEGKIYFWDHEREAEMGNPDRQKNLFSLASSFEQFLESLRRFDPNEIKLKPGQVKSVWVDPSLRGPENTSNRG